MKKINLNGFIEETKEANIFSVIVLQGGEVVGEYHSETERVRNQYSVSKSFTSTAVGFAVEEGLLNLDDRILDFFPKEAPEKPSDNLKALKLKDLLRMSTGQFNGHLMADSSFGTTPRFEILEENWVKYCLNQSYPLKPGDRFVYSNVGAYLAGVMVQKKSGMDLVEYLMPRLFEPLGINKPNWEKCPRGYNFGAGGLNISTSELSRFGQFYLQKGQWHGKQLLSKEWIKEATSKQIDTDNRGDWGCGYGYQFWRGEHNSYRADGKFGQYCIVLNDKNAVITINAHATRVRRVMEAVWTEIWTQL
ncbi:serine hydrolase domain-containing protein [Clostridium culturomicium]|uniref:serine hydrolase domain-containing protein n=1 Tax=Clostridium culturomicium TaxID=1499683 RepID=UPI0006933F77|nr:serine hydrolase [Clostridium culturomicium]